MLSFNTLLEDAGINVARTRLVRHQDRSSASGQSLYEIWAADRGRFDLYQKIQRRGRFKEAEYLASFIATPLGETLFIGLYKVLGTTTAPPGTIDPIQETNVEGQFFYILEVDQSLSEYAGRLTIDWGHGYRSWVQRAASPRPKRIREIRSQVEDLPFPGFAKFTCRIRDLSSVPHTWRGVLKSVSGVYLLVCHKDGKQYVGSAYGAGGFWSRWESYIRNNHGGNQEMKLKKESDYQVSILEVASSTMSADEIIKLEAYWKDKLLTKKFGLNRN